MTTVVYIPVLKHLFYSYFIFTTGLDQDGKEVFLWDIWPTRQEIQTVEREVVVPAMFRDVYSGIEVS